MYPITSDAYTPMISFERSQFDLCGWTAGTFERDIALCDIARAIGVPVPPRPDRPITRELRPLKERDAEPGSLSSILGQAKFPLHTDCAYYRRPPSYILFRAVRPSTVATLFVDGVSLLDACESRIHTALFRVRGLRKYFLCTMATERGLRWDLNCMAPADMSAHEAAADFSARSSAACPARFEWNDTSTVLLLNNRRMLHGRECAYDDPHRHLESILVHSNGGSF